MVMHAEYMNRYDHDICPICIIPFAEGDDVKIIQSATGATHLVHSNCVDRINFELLSHHGREDEKIELQSKLWRYMDVAKFIEMLRSSSIYFASPESFGDIFEGAHGVIKNKDIWDNYYRNFLKAAVITAPDNKWHYIDSESLHENVEKVLTQLNQKHGGSIFISCWHNNDFESEAMWKMYATNTKNAVAVQTTYERLHDQIGTQTEIRRIKYIDYENRFVGVNEEFWYKRKSFEHEREVRAIVHDWNAIGKNGVSINVDLNQLIDKVYVSPYSQDWFKELVEDIIIKYGYSFSVEDSSMRVEPF